MIFQPNLIPRFNHDYNFNDFVYGVKSIFRNQNYDNSILTTIFGEKDFFFTNNGRSSLYVILRSLNLPKGSKIGVPLYSCTVVFDAILKAGHIPRFIDIDLNNYTMDPQDLKNKINELSAVIVIHTFGRPAELDEIKKVAVGLPIIEDCAHSLLSEYKGEITGTIGIASFYSLSKYISSGGGGMIVLNNNKLKENFKNEMNFLISPTKINEINNSIFRYLYSFFYHKPWFGLFAFQVGSLVENSVDITGKKQFKTSKIKKSEFSLFIKKIKNFNEKIEIQRKYSQFLLEQLKNTGLILPFEHKNTMYNYFLFPILFENKNERDNAYEFLKKNDIDTAKLYSQTPSTAIQVYGYTGDCPASEKLADTLLTIPNHYSLNIEELLKIADIITKIGDYI